MITEFGDNDSRNNTILVYVNKRHRIPCSYVNEIIKESFTSNNASFTLSFTKHKCWAGMIVCSSQHLLELRGVIYAWGV